MHPTVEWGAGRSHCGVWGEDHDFRLTAAGVDVEEAGGDEERGSREGALEVGDGGGEQYNIVSIDEGSKCGAGLGDGDASMSSTLQMGGESRNEHDEEEGGERVSLTNASFKLDGVAARVAGESYLCGGGGVEALEDAKHWACDVVVTDENQPEDIIIQTIECFCDIKEGSVEWGVAVLACLLRHPQHRDVVSCRSLRSEAILLIIKEAIYVC